MHTFEQGPDGMLYFLQSIYIHTHLETPYGIRRLWRWRMALPSGNPARRNSSKGLINLRLVFDDYG